MWQPTTSAVKLSLDSVDSDCDKDDGATKTKNDSGSESSEPEPMYTIEDIWDMKGNKPNREFLIKWEGFDKSENSWEPEESIAHILFVQEYIAKVEKIQRSCKQSREDLDKKKEEERRDRDRKDLVRKKELERRERERKKGPEGRGERLKSPEKVNMTVSFAPNSTSTETQKKPSVLPNKRNPKESNPQPKQKVEKKPEPPKPKPIDTSGASTKKAVPISTDSATSASKKDTGSSLNQGEPLTVNHKPTKKVDTPMPPALKISALDLDSDSEYTIAPAKPISATSKPLSGLKNVESKPNIVENATKSVIAFQLEDSDSESNNTTFRIKNLPEFATPEISRKSSPKSSSLDKTGTKSPAQKPQPDSDSDSEYSVPPAKLLGYSGRPASILVDVTVKPIRTEKPIKRRLESQLDVPVNTNSDDEYPVPPRKPFSDQHTKAAKSKPDKVEEPRKMPESSNSELEYSQPPARPLGRPTQSVAKKDPQPTPTSVEKPKLVLETHKAPIDSDSDFEYEIPPCRPVANSSKAAVEKSTGEVKVAKKPIISEKRKPAVSDPETPQTHGVDLDWESDDNSEKEFVFVRGASNKTLPQPEATRPVVGASQSDVSKDVKKLVANSDQPITRKNQDVFSGDRTSKDGSPETAVVKPFVLPDSDNSDSGERSDSGSGDSDQEFEVEKVIDVRGVAPNREFEVKWLNYSSKHNSWEPEEGVRHLDVTKEFLANRVKKLTRLPHKHRTEGKRKHSSSCHVSPAEGSPEIELSSTTEKPSAKPGKSSGKMVELYKTYDPNRTKKVDPLYVRPKKPPPPEIKKRVKEKERKTSAVDDEDGVLASYLTPKTFCPKWKIPTKKLDANNSLKTSEVERDAKPNGVHSKSGHKMTPVQETQPVICALAEDVTDDQLKMAGFTDTKLFRMIIGDNTEKSKREPKKLFTRFSREKQPLMRNPDPSRFDGLRKRIDYLKTKTLSTNYFECENATTPKIPRPVTQEDHIIEKACSLWLVASAGIPKNLRDPEVITDFTWFFRHDPHRRYEAYLKSATKQTDELPIEIPLFINMQMKSKDIEEYLAERDGRPVQSFNRKTASKFVQRVKRRGYSDRR